MRFRPGLAGAATAALALAMPAGALAQFGDVALRRGSRGHDVRVLQSWLGRLDYSTTVDGVFGSRTQRSVRRFEHHQRLPVNGVASRSDEALMRKLIGAATSAPQVETVSGDSAVLSGDGRTALAPATAPEAVRQVIAAANEITDKPYRYGGGHGAGFDDTAFDCSGSVSHALHGADLLKRPMASGELEHWGVSGPGNWITVYANPGHAYMVVAGLRFDTSGRGEDGPRWRPRHRRSRGYVARHPDGL